MASPASRRELVLMLTLNELSDDYENLTVSIMPDFDRIAEDYRITVEKSEVADALKELVELGWAKAYLPRSGELVEVEGMPFVEDLDGPDGAWFYITDAGRKVQNEYDAWPWDGEGGIRKDWTPPED